jgi:hypothetical protein
MDAPTITGRYRHDVPNDGLRFQRLRCEKPAEPIAFTTDLAAIELRVLAHMIDKGELPDGLALRS